MTTDTSTTNQDEFAPRAESTAAGDVHDAGAFGAQDGAATGSASAPAPSGAATPATRIIGRTSATDREPNTSDQFAFWLTARQIVNPFDIVQVEQVGVDGSASGSTTYGLVTNLSAPTDAPSHMANYISNNFGEVGPYPPNTIRQSLTLASVNVLENSDDIYMPVASEQPVSFVAPDGVATALGVGEVPDEHRLAVGLVQMSASASTSRGAMAFVDSRFVVGPEGAHLTISGISGLATKTSYAMFLLQAIQQKIDCDDVKEIAFIILNVKQADLLCIDEAGPPLDPEQRDMWDRMGLVPRPFPNVHYYLPRGKRGPNSFDPKAGAANARTYAYDLEGAADKFDLLFSNVSDSSNTIESMVVEIATGFEEKSSGQGKFVKVNSWVDLLDGEPLTDKSTSAPKALGDIKPASVGKFRRQLRRLVRGPDATLFPDRLGPEVRLSDEMKAIQGGHTYVIDIAKLRDHEQTLVFGDLLRSIYDLKSTQGSVQPGQPQPPKQAVFFVDELNKYAPSTGHSSPIAQQVLDVAERGRGVGIILVSAAQFMSAVHPRVTGNTATRVMGRTGASEVTQPDYRFMDSNLKNAMTRLAKGELIVSHALYRQPIKITFPKPAYKQPS